MRPHIERLVDGIGWRILAALSENARIPFSELGRQVGLSAPAVAERVRRMELRKAAARAAAAPTSLPRRRKATRA